MKNINQTVDWRQDKRVGGSRCRRTAPRGPPNADRRTADSTIVSGKDILPRMSKLPAYSTFVTEFLREAQLPRISAQEPTPDRRLIQRVAVAKDHEIAGEDGPASRCTRSLLFIAAGGLDQAHRIVQEISTSDGAYIHGMVHRVDDDFDNARYWFRRAGVQPAATEMYRRAAASSVRVASHPIWDPFLVTDMVETSRTAGVTEELRAVLTIEFEVLLESCVSASGKARSH
jgi:hypothetical protein